MHHPRPKCIAAQTGVLLVALSLAAVLASTAPARACPQGQIDAFVRDLTDMSTRAEASVRYLVPQFRDCGQGAIASQLDGSPEWLLSMRQQLQAQAKTPAALGPTIDTALANLGKTEASLQEHYALVLQGIDSMYDNRFSPKCRRERPKIVDNMKSTRPLVPVAIEKLNSLKTCLATP